MASQHQVKQYLAHWFQLGKKVLIHNGTEFRLPQFVVQGERYSREFEDCWKEILSPESGECYLEGTEETIQDLLSSKWEIESCARCSLLVPIKTVGMPPTCCPCFDLPTWPNMETPLPRLPISTRLYLLNICNRLTDTTETDNCESG
ncbi:conserved hypothetical protein [Planktothrix serta PCC 8927]|uniref:Uncharacterized protein n=1 Tax=Planktothrix serta PCC 8927 TaxID=671068 RepID=A0A7Z9BUU7_9CYAN|nr:hypothetical protein [Planktothrix serta]VXD21797.1 conserved hypothetical protein [Planktothrix serta PCC 8927]